MHFKEEKMKKKLLILLISTLVITGTMFGAGKAETDLAFYPSRNLTVIVPYSAGGGSDTLTRHVDNYLSEILGYNLNFEYLPGAGGAVGVTKISGSKADGYTIGTANIPHILLQELTGVGAFDVEKFDYIGQVAMTSLVLVTPKASPIKTLDDFILAVKAKPGSITVGLPGAMGDSTVAAWKLQEEAGLDFVTVNYDGGATMLAAILGGHIDAGFAAINMAVSERSQMNLLATTLPKGQRDPELSDIKTLAELGFDVEVTCPRIYLAPYGMPKEAYNTLVDAFEKVANNPNFQKSVRDLSFTPEWISGPDLHEFVKSYKPTIKSLIDKYYKE